jgi:hypothetical protein
MHCGGSIERSNAPDGSPCDANPIAKANVDPSPETATVLDAAMNDAGGDATSSDASEDALEALEAGDAADPPTFIQLTDDGSCPQEIARFFYEDAGSCAANQDPDNTSAPRCLSVPFNQLPCQSGCVDPQVDFTSSVDFNIIACDQHGRGILHGYGNPVGKYCCIEVAGLDYSPGLEPVPLVNGGPESESNWCAQSVPGYMANVGGYSYFAIGDFVDTDGDMWLDIVDNCPTISNLDQADSDEDGVGDACDNCPYTFNPDQTSTISPGIGDACNCAAMPSPPLGPNGCACASGSARDVIDAGSQCKMVARGQSSCGDGGDVCGRCLPLIVGSL